MATTLPNMGLKQWNLATDTFSYSEWSTNVNLIDLHDHSSGKGVQIPTGGIANGAVTNAKLATNAIDATKVLAASLTDAKLTSPNNGVYRSVLETGARLGGLSTGVVYLLGTSPSSLVQTGVDSTNHAMVVYLAATDFNVPNLSTNLSIATTALVNATAPAATITVSLYPVTSTAGAAGALRYNTAAPYGSAATLTTPSSSSMNRAVSADMGLPTDGYYALGFQLSANQAVNSLVGLTARLRVHHT